MAVAMSVGHAQSIRNLSNSEMKSYMISNQLLSLTSKVQSGELSLEQAHNIETGLMQQKVFNDFLYEASKYIEEERKNKKKESIQRNFGFTL